MCLCIRLSVYFLLCLPIHMSVFHSSGLSVVSNCITVLTSTPQPPVAVLSSRAVSAGVLYVYVWLTTFTYSVIHSQCSVFPDAVGLQSVYHIEKLDLSCHMSRLCGEATMGCACKEPMLAQVFITIHQHCHSYLSLSLSMVTVIVILDLIDITVIAASILVIGTH